VWGELKLTMKTTKSLRLCPMQYSKPGEHKTRQGKGLLIHDEIENPTVLVIEEGSCNLFENITSNFRIVCSLTQTRFITHTHANMCARSEAGLVKLEIFSH